VASIEFGQGARIDSSGTQDRNEAWRRRIEHKANRYTFVGDGVYLDDAA
jgi:hypothetical protein